MALFFLFFPMKVAGATIFIVGRESPQPPPLIQLYGLHVHHDFAQHRLPSLDQMPQMERKLPITTTLKENAAPNHKNVAFARGFNKKNLGTTW